MTLSRTMEVDRIEVLSSGLVQVRVAERIMDDGTCIARAYRRSVLAPGDDLANQDDTVRAVANAVWTPEVVAAYRALAEAQTQGV